MERKKNVIELKITACGIDEILKKSKKLVELLEEAKTLADELASSEVILKIDV